MSWYLRAFFLIATLIYGEAKAAQDQEHYRQAMARGISTGPYFVLVTIRDDIAGTAFTGCISANTLKFALFYELGGELDSSGDQEKRKAENLLFHVADEIGLNNIDHDFHFSKPAALAQIPAPYTQDDLTEARKIVQTLGVEAFGSGPNTVDWRALGRLRESAALACAIIEQGASAHKPDIGGRIYSGP
jgi:hypothetical protein